MGLNDEEIYYLNYLNLDSYRSEFVDDLLGKKLGFADLSKALYDFFNRMYPEKDHGSKIRRVNRVILKAKNLYRSNMFKILPFRPNHLMYQAVISDNLDARPMLIQYRSIYGDLPEVH